MSADAIARRLGRKSPPAAWEGAFLIGIFPRAAEQRWCKLQLFSGGRDPERHCLSALEGMDGDAQVLVLRGSTARVDHHEHRAPRGALEVGAHGWSFVAPGIEWRGEWPVTRARGEALGGEARAEVRDVLTWVDLPRVLTYWSAFGALELDGVRGVALVEHAWGTDTRVDVLRRGPRRWQWDVLAFDDGSACAALAIDLAFGTFGVRGGGRVPGERFETSALSRIVVDAWGDEAERRVPARWRGSLRFGSGEVLRYEAIKSTPVAPVVPDGGFLGFDFVAKWNGRALEGTGFTEYRG